MEHRFEHIYGQEHAKRHIQQAIAHNQISHAYLIQGATGSGKKLFANTMAKTILCKNNDIEPCGICLSCHMFEAGTHPDVIRIQPEKKSLGVQLVREKIVEDVAIKPYQEAYKIYIIEQADTLTVEAQNALLKTIEEPPAYAIFLLLAENTQSFLPTIRSRVVQIHLYPLPEHVIVRYLQKQKQLSEEQSQLYAAYAQGCIGQALTLLEDESFSKMREDILEKLIHIQNVPMSCVFSWAKEWEQYKNDWRFLDIIQLWYRDLLLYRKLHEEHYLVQKDLQTQIFQCAIEPAEVLAKKAMAVSQAKRRLSQNANFRMTMEVLLLELKEKDIHD